ncbi:MAG: DNA repair protein RecO [Acidobacteria bacterium]|nr:DNA repair protein RecO [Acidobacteriota bacterium]
MPDDRMPLHTADALVVRTYKLGEADRIVVFLTSDRGKRRGVARGARRPRSRYAGALEPLTLGRVAYFEREQRELVRLRYVEPVCSPLAAPSAEGLAHVGYFAELIDEWAPEADPNERLFRLGAAVVQALATGVSVERLARYFEYWLLRLQGVYPSERGLNLSPAALAFLQSARELPPARLDEASLPLPAERELATAHQTLITNHLEKHLKSLKVLNAVASG